MFFPVSATKITYIYDISQIFLKVLIIITRVLLMTLYFLFYLNSYHWHWDTHDYPSQRIVFGCLWNSDNGLAKVSWSHHFESFTVATMTWLTAMEYLFHKWPRICSTFLTRLTRRVPLVEQELLTLPEHVISPPVFRGVRVTRFAVLCVMLFVLFLLAIVLSVLLRYTDFHYPFRIFKLLLSLSLDCLFLMPLLYSLTLI